MTDLQIIPAGTTHIITRLKTCYDGKERLFTNYYRVTPFTFNDRTAGTRIEYFNYDWESWQGCVNSYDEILALINSKDQSVTTI